MLRPGSPEKIDQKKQIPGGENLLTPERQGRLFPPCTLAADGALERKLLGTRMWADRGREIQRGEQVLLGKKAEDRTEHGEEEETELVS